MTVRKRAFLSILFLSALVALSFVSCGTGPLGADDVLPPETALDLT